MKLKTIMILICFLLFAVAPRANAFTCNPCTICGLTTWGGSILPDTKEVTASVESLFSEEQKQMFQTIRKKLILIKETAVGAIEKVTDFLNDPFGTIGGWLGLDDEEEKDQAKTETEKQAQKNSKGDVEDRMKANLSTYKDEQKGDYKSEGKTADKRRYIEQQASIKLLARTLVLKSHFKDIEKLITKVDKAVSKTIDGADGGTENSTSSSVSEAKLVREQAELYLVYYRLMQLQTQIDAAYLEYEANKSLSNMKKVKAVPQIKSSQTEGVKGAK